MVGRERPAVGDSVQRGEGVAIILSCPVICAWKKQANSGRHGVRGQSQLVCRWKRG